MANDGKLTRHDAGNLLMVGASLIVALHIGLFSIWVSAISGSLIKLADKIALFGIIFMVLNIIFWIGSRQFFNKLLKENNSETELNPYISAGLIVPMLIVLFGWSGAYSDGNNLAIKSIHKKESTKECKQAHNTYEPFTCQ
jgi:hypothetical protein